MCLTIDELRGLCTPDNIYLTLHASKKDLSNVVSSLTMSYHVS